MPIHLRQAMVIPRGEALATAVLSLVVPPAACAKSEEALQE